MFVKNKLLDVEIYIVVFSLRTRDIDATTHETNEYVQISVYFWDIKNEQQILIRITKELYLINDLKTNLLIDNDFLESENFTININNKKISIANCDVMINLVIK